MEISTVPEASCRGREGGTEEDCVGKLGRRREDPERDTQDGREHDVPLRSARVDIDRVLSGK